MFIVLSRYTAIAKCDDVFALISRMRGTFNIFAILRPLCGKGHFNE